MQTMPNASTATASHSTAIGSHTWRSRLRHLPRDTRDTLFLLAVIAWVILPHYSNVPAWCLGMALTVLCWRGYLALTGSPLPGRWWRVGLLGAAIAGTLLSYGTLLGQQAGVTLIVALITLKTLELRARRDAYVIFFLGFFALLTHFIFSQQLLIGLAMIIGVWGLLAAVINAQMHPGSTAPLMHSVRTSGWLMLLGAPIMAVLFVLFPRIDPLWGIPIDHQSGRTGLSGSMEMGTVAKLAQDDSIALRVAFDGDAPPPQQMYWRGPVLSEFDGRKWEMHPIRYAQPASFVPQTSGTAYTYQVTMEPSNRPWLTVLEATPDAPAVRGHQTYMSPDLQWFTRKPITELRRFTATSYTRYRYGEQLSAYEYRRYTYLPASYNPRTLEFAQRWLREKAHAEGDAANWSREALQLLQTGGYGYTLEPGTYGRDGVDEFLFDRKLGFCEHIASSFVVLMRALKVPARVVTGYQGAEYNAVGDFWAVRNSDAHAWAEIWHQDTGWVRIDPTSVVAPARLSDNLRLAPAPGMLANAADTLIGDAVIRNLRNMWEAANNRWTQWVLNYSQDNQFDLLKHLGFTAPDWADIGYIIAALLLLGSIAGAAWGYWERSQQDPWLRLLHQAQMDLRKAGWLPDLDLDEKAADNSANGTSTSKTLTPQQLRTALEQHPNAPPATHDWLLALERLRYAPHTSGNTGGAGDAGHKTALRELRQQWKKVHLSANRAEC